MSSKLKSRFRNLVCGCVASIAVTLLLWVAMAFYFYEETYYSCEVQPEGSADPDPLIPLNFTIEFTYMNPHRPWEKEVWYVDNDIAGMAGHRGHWLESALSDRTKFYGRHTKGYNELTGKPGNDEIIFNRLTGELTIFEPDDLLDLSVKAQCSEIEGAH